VYRDPRLLEPDLAGLDDLRELGIDARVLDGAALARGGAGAARGHGRRDRVFPATRSCVRSVTPRNWRGACASSAVKSRKARASRRWKWRMASSAVCAWRRGWRARATCWWRSALVRALPGAVRHPPADPAGQGYSQTYSPPALAPNMPLVLREHSVCVTAWADGFRLGSTMEFSGYDDSLNDTRLAALERGARDYLRRTGRRRNCASAGSDGAR
jgi:D-amino-acid dehydrogenase